MARINTFVRHARPSSWTSQPARNIDPDQVKHSLLGCQIFNIDQRWLISFADIERILNAECIALLLQAYGIYPNESSRRFHEKNLAETISRNGLRTFAALVYAGNGNKIADFLEKDINDSSLPISSNDLKSKLLLECTSVIDQFFEDQYHFLVRTIDFGSIFHRVLDERLILPFISGKREASGASATVTEFSIMGALDTLSPKVRSPLYSLMSFGLIAAVRSKTHIA